MSQKLMQWRSDRTLGSKRLYVCDRHPFPDLRPQNEYPFPLVTWQASNDEPDLKGIGEFLRLYFEEGYTLLPDPREERTHG